MFTAKFWKDAIERAIKTFAQVVVSLVLALTPTIGFDTLQIAWLPILGVGTLASVISVLTSLGSTLVGDKNSASLVK